jgi:WD40 repeat protein
MSFSSCGNHLATCSSEDETLRVWHTATGGCTLEIPRSEHGQPVAISFSHDSRYIAAAYTGRGYPEEDLSLLAVIYDMNTGNVIETYALIEAALATSTHMLHLAFASGLSNTLFVASISIEGCLELWCTKLVSHTFEKVWSVPTGIEIYGRELFTISANSSLVSCFSRNDRSITSWQLESGAFVSSHHIELAGDLFVGFLEYRGSDLIYSTKIEKRFTDDGLLWLGRHNVQKLNTRTGQVDSITYMKEPWRPQAISLTTGAIAYTKSFSNVVYMIDLLQCPKTDNTTSYESPSLIFVSVSQNGEMVLMVYHDHLELRDVLGNIVFRSLKADYDPFRGVACVSGDGGVVAACLNHGSHVWFVKSGRELQLPDVNSWPCSPAVSGDGKLMAFFVKDPRESSGGNITYQSEVGRMFVWDLENDQECKVIDRSKTFMLYRAWMLFSGDNKTLHTHEGDFDLETRNWNPGSLYVPMRSKSKISISDDKSWLRLNREDMLWLPESYRREYSIGECFGKDTVAYSCQDGSAVVMQLVDPFE